MFRPLKYFTPLTLYVLCFLSFLSTGWIVWLPVLFSFVLIPLLELFITPDESNLETAEAELAKRNRLYDLLLYAVVVLQFAALFCFVYQLKHHQYSSWDLIGKIVNMGLLCGTFGINVGHELGQRGKSYEQWMAKALLATSLYMHFFTEHNKGHHRYVATPRDPASARLNEPLITFLFRTIIFSYISAWKIANTEMKKKNKPVLV